MDKNYTKDPNVGVKIIPGFKFLATYYIGTYIIHVGKQLGTFDKKNTTTIINYYPFRINFGVPS